MEKNRIEKYSAEYWAAFHRLEELLAKAETELQGLNWEEVK